MVKTQNRSPHGTKRSRGTVCADLKNESGNSSAAGDAGSPPEGKDHAGSRENNSGIDPYEPIADEDEGFPGWFASAILALIAGIVSILAFLLETGGNTDEK